VIGRDEEIRRVIQVLSRATKNNPVLIGEPGVGKTAIVEGLAQRIVGATCPRGSKDKTVFALDMGALVAGRQVPRRVRGAAQGRARRRSKNPTAASSSSSTSCTPSSAPARPKGAMDAGNMLKPMLARGELRCIGATTLDEYRKHIEKDAALERRFQPVFVGEPSVEDTIAILRGLRSATRSTTACGSRTARWWRRPPCPTATSPTASCPTRRSTWSTRRARRLRTEIDSLPAELDEVTRRMMQLEIEEEALAKEKDRGEQGAARHPAKELADLRGEEADALRAQWESEKERDAIQRCAAMRSRSSARHELERAERATTSSGPPSSSTASMPDLEKQLAAEQKKLAEATGPGCCARRSPTRRSPRSSPVDRHPGDRARGGRAREAAAARRILHERVVGQDEAVGGGRRGDPRARAGIKDPRRPIGSFLFLGPTGVGKTELAKTLAQALFDSEDASSASTCPSTWSGTRLAADRRAARGTSATRRAASSPRPCAAALLGGALRRDREGPPRRVQRPAAGARRRPAHRQPGPHGRLQEHRRDHDEQHRHPVYGARPLKRYLQRELETKIGRALIAGSIRDGAAIRVDLVDGALRVDATQPTTPQTKGADQEAGATS
jgi:ATP-dependent Clp protease ATP-binding subunit ClpB